MSDDVITETDVLGGEDRIGALPDDLLRHLLSFLPSRGAVQTCSLAKRRRTLWRSVPALRIHDPESYDCVTGSSTFADELIRHRIPTPLDVCDITSLHDDDDSYAFNWAFCHIEPLLQYAMACQVRGLRISFRCQVTDTSTTLISSHLRRLQLCHMLFEYYSLDFASCHVLEVLELANCDIRVDILSRSLRHLNIHGGGFGIYARTRISAPNLITLKLEQDHGLTPLLDSVPSLVRASVKNVCEYEEYGEESFSVVLEGLSSATNLELIAPCYNQDSVFIMDLKWCPIFSKLKTVLLSEWCVVDNFTGLIYFLQHSPILETLTVQLKFGSQVEHVIERAESYNSSEQSKLSKHLKLVKIICDAKDDTRFHHILRILRTHGLLPEQIDTQ